MSAAHYLHELGETFLADDTGGIFLALPSESVDPDELLYVAEVFEPRYEKAVTVGEWLEREIAEGRATRVDHYLSVEV